MRYVLIEIDKTTITLLQKVDEENRVQVLNSKKPNQMLWAVKSFKEGIDMINAHNEKMKGFALPTKSIAQAVIPEWDWSKLTTAHKKKLKELYSNKDFEQIFLLHNDLKLTNLVYCCTGYERHVHFNMEILETK